MNQRTRITIREKPTHLNLSQLCSPLLCHLLSLWSATIFAVARLAVGGTSACFLHWSVDTITVHSYSIVSCRLNEKNIVIMDGCFWINAPHWCAWQHRKKNTQKTVTLIHVFTLLSPHNSLLDLVHQDLLKYMIRSWAWFTAALTLSTQHSSLLPVLLSGRVEVHKWWTSVVS